MKGLSLKDSFAEFLRHGNLGPISIESTLNDVTAILGDPDGIDRYENHIVENGVGICLTNLYYSTLFMSFQDEEMFQFNIEMPAPSGRFDLLQVLGVDWVSTVEQVPISKVIEFLLRNQIMATEIKGDWLPDDERVLYIEGPNIKILGSGPIDPKVYKIVCKRGTLRESMGGLHYKAIPINL